MASNGGGSITAYPALIVGVLTVLGGAAGYARKGSKISLAAGLIFGGCLIYSGVLISSSGDNVMKGYKVASIVSGIMVTTTLPRLMKSKKFMPSGMIVTLGIICCSYYTNKLLAKDAKDA